MIAVSVKDADRLVGMLLGWGADVNQTSECSNTLFLLGLRA